MRIAKARVGKWYTFNKQRDAIAAKMYAQWYERKMLDQKERSAEGSDFRFIYWDGQ